MEILAFILAIAAGVVFLCATWTATTRANLVAAGLALLTAAWIVQECSRHHRIHF